MIYDHHVGYRGALQSNQQNIICTTQYIVSLTIIVNNGRLHKYKKNKKQKMYVKRNDYESVAT